MLVRQMSSLRCVDSTLLHVRHHATEKHTTAELRGSLWGSWKPLPMGCRCIRLESPRSHTTECAGMMITTMG